MYIKPFAVEEWMNEYEVGALYNIAETCVDSVSLDELFELTGENKEDFLKDFCAQRLTYGDIWGSEALRSVGRRAREEIFALFPELRDRPDHAASEGARHLASGRMGRKLAVRHAQHAKALVQ